MIGPQPGSVGYLWMVLGCCNMISWHIIMLLGLFHVAASPYSLARLFRALFVIKIPKLNVTTSSSRMTVKLGVVWL
jgi:hypothetical protein